MIGKLIAALWKPIAFIAALVWAWLSGRRNAKLKADLKSAREYAETMERMNEVENLPPADAREFLHKRGQQ